MSASDKKKLRKEQNAAKEAQKQQAQAKETRKLKTASIAFISVLVVILVTGLTVFTINTIKSSAIRERKTIALTLDGNVELDSIQMSYYFIDTLENQVNNNYYNLLLMGLDFTKPLDEQEYTEGKTWADYFVELAAARARDEYALAQHAEKNGYVLSEENEALLKSAVQEKALTAQWSYGYASLDDFLRVYYCNGANEESYTAYLRTGLIAENYYVDYGDSLTFTDAQRREHEKDNPMDYNSFTYASYLVSYTNYLELEEGASAADATEDQVKAALEKAELVAKDLTRYNTPEALLEAISALPYNEGKTLTLDDIVRSKVSYTQLLSKHQTWLSATERTAGDTTYIANETTSYDEDGNEVQTVTGYTVMLFQSMTDNTQPLANVRHLLVSFKGGTYDEDTQTTTYSDEEKAAAKETAEGLMAEWQERGGSKELFIEMIEKYTDDTASVEDGGLYTDIAPNSSYVTAFLDWATDETHEVGDYGLIETEYGYHIMFFDSFSDLNYRDSMIDSELRTETVDAWYTEVTSPIEMKIGNTRFLKTDFILSPAEEEEE